MKAFVTSLLLASAITAGAASQREVRAAWLAPAIEPAVSLSAVDRLSAAGFNTVMIRVQTPAGVAWNSAFAPMNVTASMTREDVLAEMLERADAARMEAWAVVMPDDATDDADLAALYREMLLSYPFRGVVIDASRLSNLPADTRREIVDRLTLELTNEFPTLLTAVAETPDRAGKVASEASAMIADGIIDYFVVKTPERFPMSLLTEQWDDRSGVIMTFPDAEEALEARFRRTPWGIAFNAPDEAAARTISAGLFADYAHLPQLQSRPTEPEPPADAEQLFTGSDYVVSWRAPEWIDEDAPVSYYTVYDDKGTPVIAKTTATEVTVPSDNPYRRFSVSAWDTNHGESMPAPARAVAASVADELLPSGSEVEVSCNNAVLSLKSRNTLGTVDIYNLEGMVVKSRRINRPAGTINCSNLPAGVYVVAVRDPEGTVCSKKFLLK